MNGEAHPESTDETDSVSGRAAGTAPPTTPCTVVWSQGRAFVLEAALSGNRWVGFDQRGRPQSLSSGDLQRRGWSRHR
ncbi:hypothetical protein EV191_10785 [Tamaricihabitans halophyticus]|uniref:Uncharacterized protein n=1 Tax=Tamaricihabitans halophyticus TaxID=1262583 RepID=A0A4R2QMM8_9PSEU|nr:hypothetical protein [Tamaricihabitans halophyticus]TCP50823.1 hypothetical protein EV191_10785 [Tamaricihabitans halophyticus]